MDIHPPDGPTHSLKDFAIHILVVTIGILIALGLEGVRETVHERKLLREAHENFTVEYRHDQGNLKLDLESVDQMAQDIDAITADLSHLETDPASVKTRVGKLQFSGYFVTSTSWTAALSSGALALMKTEEVDKYAGANFSVQTYSGLESASLPLWIDLESYVASRQSFGTAEVSGTEQRLRALRMYLETMRHTGNECAQALERALKDQ